jgi:cytochrome c-type biogenesis protein
MEAIFQALSRAVEGAPAAALAAAFLWGVASVVLSPCHLASIPLIIGFIDRQGQVATGRAFRLSVAFASAILLSIALVGAVTAAAGRIIGDAGPYVKYAVAGVFVLVGLYLLDVIPAPWSGPGQVSVSRKGLAAAFLLGLIFGVAVGPCTFAYMAPVLGVTLTQASKNAPYAAGLVASWGIGHCAVIVAAGTSTRLVQRILNWNERSRGAGVLKKACGALVILGGLWLIYTA